MNNVFLQKQGKYIIILIIKGVVPVIIYKIWAFDILRLLYIEIYLRLINNNALLYIFYL